MHKTPDGEPSRASCDPSGIRTRVTAVRGQRTRPLYDGAACNSCQYRTGRRRGANQLRKAGIEHREGARAYFNIHRERTDSFAVRVANKVG